jgi:putative transposase
MDGSILLSRTARKSVLEMYRSEANPQVRLRAHILLLLDDDQPWAAIVAFLYTSTRTINRWRCRYLEGGLEAVLERRWRRSLLGNWWLALMLRWVTATAPTDFGFVRSRWTCATVALLLKEQHGVRVSRETIRRRLRSADLVWRRPRPVIRLKDPEYASKLEKIKQLLAHLPADETAFFQDEVDVNTNPKIGSMWMRKGKQAEVPTPGDNTKRYLAGSLHVRTGELILSEPGKSRNTDLFLAHLDDLRKRFRCYRVIHVICDNAKSHKAKRVQEYLARHGDRIQIHYLPTRAPETNPIERVWWHLHDEITRNHRCPDIDSLLDLIIQWLNAGSHFEIETSIYKKKPAA